MISTGAKNNMSLVIVIIASIACAALASSTGVTFQDVSESAGMVRLEGRRTKYGGAAVADLDGDGYPDLLCGHHDNRHIDLYFNNGNGTFSLNSWRLWVDAHGINPFRFSVWRPRMHFSVSRGGSNGNDPKPPLVFRVDRNRTIVDVTAVSGLERNQQGRGRSAVYMSLRRRGLHRPDALFTNAPLSAARGARHHSAFQLKHAGRFAARPLVGFANETNTYATVTDIDGDGTVELLSFHELRMYRVVGLFAVRDVSTLVLPDNIDLRGVVGVAELDFDNDGRFDLYIARTASGDLGWVPVADLQDRLLRNVGGRYVDATESANIPRRNTQSRGVTTGDFNNDGWVDLLVTHYDKQDTLLLNNGDGTFTERSAGFQRAPNVRGDAATAVDFDSDGRLDVIVSEGDWFRTELGGYYRIMKNITPSVGRYLLVRVKSSPKRAVTSLHAVTIVKAGGMQMVKRVGSPGTAVSNSYIELLHFGLGASLKADMVSVRWSDGDTRRMSNVAAGQTVTFGV